MNHETLTAEKLKEAVDLIKALAPKEAPPGTLCILRHTGLKILKNDMMPEDTIVVSKRLFDMLYEASGAQTKPVRPLPYWEPCNQACDPELGQGRDRSCECAQAVRALAAEAK
jgi:hypothetical protein